MKGRFSESQAVSPGTCKRVKCTLSTLVRDHMLNCQHTVAWEDSQTLVESQTTPYWKQKKSISLNETTPL